MLEYTTKKFFLQYLIECCIIAQYELAGMAELADAHGSGPCESDFMQVQVLFPAPTKNRVHPDSVFCYMEWNRI